MNQAIYLHEKDNVATVLADFPPGSKIEAGPYCIQTLECIPFGHKVSLTHLNREDPILKYGAVIGKATREIPAGCCVHVHNMTSLRGLGK